MLARGGVWLPEALGARLGESVNRERRVQCPLRARRVASVRGRSRAGRAAHRAVACAEVRGAQDGGAGARASVGLRQWVSGRYRSQPVVSGRALKGRGRTLRGRDARLGPRAARSGCEARANAPRAATSRHSPCRSRAGRPCRRREGRCASVRRRSVLLMHLLGYTGRRASPRRAILKHSRYER